jgi:hypothetical protein
MKHDEIYPVLIPSGIINCGFISLLIALAWRNYRLGVKEFYRSFIIIYGLIAYSTRTALYFLMYFLYSDDEFNRDNGPNSHDNIRLFTLFIEIPIM